MSSHFGETFSCDFCMEKHRVEIFSPRFDGERFKEHRLPLDIVEDLFTLQLMTIEMAKSLYLEQNPDRQRVPKNFTKGISFELESLEPGSTIPKIILIASMAGLFPHQNVTFFEQAKESIVNAIQAADSGGTISKYAPDNVLYHFNKFGKKLRPDEFIEFNPKGSEKAIFTRETRRKLILASSKTNNYIEDVKLRGLVSEMDQSNRTFRIQLIDGKQVESSYDDSTEEILKDAFNTYLNGQRVLLNGSGVFNKYSKLLKIDSLDEVSLLDNKDIGYRLEELSFLKDGWLDGDGVSLNSTSLEWLSDTFEDQYSPSLPLPSIFPTPEGHIQMEWSSAKWEISILINLAERNAFLHKLNMETDEDTELTLNLINNEEWGKLNSEINVVI